MWYAAGKGTNHRRTRNALEKASQLALGIKQGKDSRRGITKKTKISQNGRFPNKKFQKIITFR